MAQDTYTVERSTTTTSPPDAVYREIYDFHRWPAWSPWEELDPQMKRAYSGAESGPGARYEWEGNRKAGQGSMQIMGVDQPSSVVIDLHFLKPFKARSEIRFSVQPEGTGSRVVWTLVGQRTIAVRVMGIFKSMDSLIGPDFERGLSKLKAAAEAAT